MLATLLELLERYDFLRRGLSKCSTLRKRLGVANSISKRPLSILVVAVKLHLSSISLGLYNILSFCSG